MSNKSKYRKICIDTLDGMAKEGDIDAMVILIEENSNRNKWLEKLAEVVLDGADDSTDEHVRELIAAEQRKAAVKLLRLTKSMADEEEISHESIEAIRNI